MIKFTVRFSRSGTGKPGKLTVHARDAEEAKSRVSVLVPGSFWHVATRATPDAA